MCSPSGRCLLLPRLPIALVCQVPFARRRGRGLPFGGGQGGGASAPPFGPGTRTLGKANKSVTEHMGCSGMALGCLHHAMSEREPCMRGGKSNAVACLLSVAAPPGTAMALHRDAGNKAPSPRAPPCLGRLRYLPRCCTQRSKKYSTRGAKS